MTKENVKKHILKMHFEDDCFAQNFEDFIDFIYDSFENKNCTTCKKFYQCSIKNIYPLDYLFENKVNCNKWEKIDDN